MEESALHHMTFGTHAHGYAVVRLPQDGKGMAASEDSDKATRAANLKRKKTTRPPNPSLFTPRPVCHTHMLVKSHKG